MVSSDVVGEIHNNSLVSKGNYFFGGVEVLEKIPNNLIVLTDHTSMLYGQVLEAEENIVSSTIQVLMTHKYSGLSKIESGSIQILYSVLSSGLLDLDSNSYNLLRLFSPLGISDLVIYNSNLTSYTDKYLDSFRFDSSVSLLLSLSVRLVTTAESITREHVRVKFLTAQTGPSIYNSSYLNTTALAQFKTGLILQLKETIV
jgi:hypothetical protein